LLRLILTRAKACDYIIAAQRDIVGGCATLQAVYEGVNKLESSVSPLLAVMQGGD
jgi:hypothetical protein